MKTRSWANTHYKNRIDVILFRALLFMFKNRKIILQEIQLNICSTYKVFL